MAAGATEKVLAVRAGARLVAVPSRHVTETMRPLPVSPLAGVPAFVLGAAIIRGIPIPVVDVAALLGDGVGTPGRFVTVTTGTRTVALAVSSVIGLRVLALGALPALLDVARGPIEAVGRLDAELAYVLGASRLVPDELWDGVQL